MRKFIFKIDMFYGFLNCFLNNYGEKDIITKFYNNMFAALILFSAQFFYIQCFLFSNFWVKHNFYYNLFNSYIIAYENFWFNACVVNVLLLVGFTVKMIKDAIPIIKDHNKKLILQNLYTIFS